MCESVKMLSVVLLLIYFIRYHRKHGIEELIEKNQNFSPNYRRPIPLP